jgi:type IV secretory pathway VirJ component
MKAASWVKGAVVAAAIAGFSLGIAQYGQAALQAIRPPVLTTQTVSLQDFEHLQRYGSVEVTTADVAPRGLVMLATQGDGDTNREDAAALAREGLIAVTIELTAFERALSEDPEDEQCHYVSDDLKDIAQAVHRALGLKRYFFPVIAGRGEGAAFAYAALAQAPDNTLAGAVSIGFHPLLHTDRPFCFDPALESAGPGAYTLRPEAALPNRWRAIATAEEIPVIEQFQHTMPKADVTAARPGAFRRALVESALRLSRTGERGTGDLPVSVIKPAGPVTGLAIILSGDGGWRDIDKTIGDLLSQQGVAVVGLDSLRYFWTKKEPDQVAADIALLLEHYGEEFGTDHHALVGFSFGADIIPDIWPLLPKAERANVRAVSLLGLGLTADFEVTVAGFMGKATSESRPLGPLLRQLPLTRTQCIYGKEDAAENETSCTAPEFDQGERIALEGGHHFDGDYGAVADAIVRHLRQNAIQEAQAKEAPIAR